MNASENNCVTDQENLAVENLHVDVDPPFWHRIYEIECELNEKYKTLNIPKSVDTVYNPVEYASELHCAFMKKFLTGPKKILFIGMNPGPFGMCQTGVPFGSIPVVRDWMKLTESVRKPDNELPTRPILGLDHKREEISGKRFWTLIKSKCGGPENFFKNCFIYNLCSLAFLKKSGANITPAELRGEFKKELQNIFLDGLENVVELISPEIIISIGNYARDRVLQLKKSSRIDSNIKLLTIPHPSGRFLKSSQYWDEKTLKVFEENDILRFFSNIN